MFSSYHRKSFFLWQRKSFWGKGFVKISAILFTISIAKILIVPFHTKSRKWWYTWLVRGRIFGVRANSRAQELSSNALQCTSGVVESVGNPFPFISLSSCIMGIASYSDWDEQCTLLLLWSWSPLVIPCRVHTQWDIVGKPERSLPVLNATRW